MNFSEEYQTKDGKKHGPYKRYIKTQDLGSLLTFECNYHEGVLEGPAAHYYDNSNPVVKGTYKNGKLHGMKKKYYVDGTLESVCQYEHGRLVGSCKEFRPDGSLKFEGVFNDDKVRGKLYFGSGYIEFEDGKLHY